MFGRLKRLEAWLELTAFFLIALFCLGAWMTRPEKAYSLHTALYTNENEFDHMVSVNLPGTWAEHFDSDYLQSRRITPNEPLVFARDVDVSINDTIPYVFYALSLNQTPSQFSLSIGKNTFKTRSMSSVIPPGAAIWRDRIDDFGSKDENSIITLSVITPNAKSFLCDFALYEAPGLALWQ